MSGLMKVYTPFSADFVRGEGVYLYDHNDKRYFDAVTGIAVNAFGHLHPHMIRSVTDQLNKLWHVSNLYTTEPQRKFARRLCEVTFADCVFIGNSGAEAVECALKTARRYFAVKDKPHKTRIITFEGSFHGRTLLCMTASGYNKDSGIGDVPDDFDVISLADPASLKSVIGEDTAGIMIEPVQGEAGIKPIPAAYLKELRDICDENDILLIFDEIQCGAGRTGKLFAHQHTDVIPDIMTVAKGIGGGFPLGACLATARAAEGMLPGYHGSTYGGNPVACSAGNAALDILLEDGFLENVSRTGRKLLSLCQELAADFPDRIAEVRGIGLMVGIQLNEKVPVRQFVEHCLKHGLAVAPASSNTVRLLPPLILTLTQTEELTSLLRNGLMTFEPPL